MPTSQMIAQACGVSRGTVDRAINNRGYVKAATKEMILEKAKEMGYTPNFLASSLKRGSTKTIGVIVFDLFNPFFSFLVNHIEQAARRANYSIYIMLTDKDPEAEMACVKSMALRKVDAIIIDAVNHREQFDMLNLSIPVVALGNKISDDYVFVGIDDYEAEKDALRYVYAKGYRYFIYVCTALAYASKTNIWAQAERHRGFLAGIEELGLTPDAYQVCSDKTYLEAVKTHLRECGEKTAVICSSDIIALNLMLDLKKEGWAIPGDVGIMGFDNINISSYIEPRLTTVNHSLDMMGETVFKVALNAIRKEQDTLCHLVPYTLFEGESV